MEDKDILKVYKITDSMKADYLFDLFLKEKNIDNIVDVYKSKVTGIEDYDYPIPWILYFCLGKDENDRFEEAMSVWAKESGLLKHPIKIDIDTISCDEAVLIGNESFVLPDNEEVHDYLFTKEYELLSTLFKDGKELGISIADREIILSNIKEIPQYGYLYQEAHSFLEKDKINNSLENESVEPAIRKRRI